MARDELFDTRELNYKLGYQRTIPGVLVDLLDTLRHSYVKGIVKDVISNPLIWLTLKDENGKTNREKYSYIFKKPNEELLEENEIINNDLVDVMPANSILCYVDEGKGANSMSGKSIIAFPFFPSHISLPVKPGEHIWLIKESVSQLSNGISFYYWMCRVSTFRQVDDINYTFLPQHERVFDGLKAAAKSGDPNMLGANKQLISSFVQPTENKQLPPEITNSTIVGSSNAFRKEFTMEPVPRKFKDCGDLLLQGSNNSHIHFTTEKFKSLKKDYLDSPEKQNLLSNPNVANNFGNFRKVGAGALDVAVGRNKARINELLTLSNLNGADGNSNNSFNAILGSREDGFQGYEAFQLDKINEKLSEDNDFARNAFSRLYLSMDGAPDKSFDVKESEAFPHQEGGSLIGYADHVRLFSESTLRLANVNNTSESNIFGMIEIDGKGQITLQSGNSEKGAKIILRPNGNIILKPGPNGLLHLGGDESDTTLSVCGVPTSIDAENGTATPEPIKSSLGGELFRTDEPAPNIELKTLLTTFAGTGATAAGAASLGTALEVPIPANDGTASSKVVIKA
jgi:hypothetical protein